MSKPLLDRQVSLLEYLTSRQAIFGDRADASLDQALQGIDCGLLQLEARFSHEKRMEKIVAVFPKTFEILGGDRAAIVRDFVEACPPVDIGRIENAGQFYDFLSAHWRREPPEPPYLRDVAACELACAQIRTRIDDRELQAAKGDDAARDGVRRHPGVILLRCAYDIQPIFEAGSGGAVLDQRDTPLAIAIPPGADHPRVFEVLAFVFDLLAALDNWTDPAALGETPELNELLRQLTEHGLLEVCP
jgi:hypothetical protein